MEHEISTYVSKGLTKKILRDFYARNEFAKGHPTDLIIGQAVSDENIAGMIDHTLLTPEATPEDIKKLCNEAKKYKFASVCVNPSYVHLCYDLLKGTDIKVCTVIGFPLGATTTESKIFEAEQSIEHGAKEIDTMINIGRLKAGDLEYAYKDIYRVIKSVKKRGVVTKVILETALLTDEEKVIACLLIKKAGADFVKTSTGFSRGGATVSDVALMKFVVGKEMGVKASGGIRSRKEAEAMVTSGADRIGASASVKIVQGE